MHVGLSETLFYRCTDLDDDVSNFLLEGRPVDVTSLTFEEVENSVVESGVWVFLEAL